MCGLESSMIEISKEQAQRFITDNQLLTNRYKVSNIVDVTKRIHNVQIDTISVVARSHDLTIFNRLPKYQEKDVWRAVKEKKLFEYWSHAICLLPIEEYPMYIWRMKYYEQNPESWWKKWITENQTVLADIYNYVKKNGPTCSSEFKRENKNKVIGWWNWKKEKSALEYLFYIGRLMIAYRKGFKRYYDLAENVLPASISSEPLPKENLAKRLVQIIFSSLGLASFEELKSYLGRGFVRILWNNNRKKMEEFLKECVETDLLVGVNITDVEQQHYVLTNQIRDLEETKNHGNQPMKFLSPFDNLVRERDYPKRLWNFEYKLEAYTPKPQRIYGYFSLPILDRHKIIGRTDAKVHRKEGKLEIKSLHFESAVRLDDELFQRLKEGLLKFADFQNCQEIQINKVKPSKFGVKIKELFM